jgi:hypothetical protein
MKYFFLWLLPVLIVFSTTSVFAEDANEEKGLGFEYKGLSGTRYVSEFGVTYLPDWFIGQDATLSSSKTGMYVGSVMIYAPERKFGASEEAGWFDGYVGKTGEVGFFEYDASVGYHTHSFDRNIEVSDTAWAGLGLKFPKVVGLTPFVGSEYDYVIEETGQNGFFWRGGFEYEVENLKVKVFATGHDQVFESKTAVLASGIASVEYQIKIRKNIRLVPTVSYQQRVEQRLQEGGLSQGGFWGVLWAKLTF